MSNRLFTHAVQWFKESQADNLLDVWTYLGSSQMHCESFPLGPLKDLVFPGLFSLLRHPLALNCLTYH